jgi:hypothetical protein
MCLVMRPVDRWNKNLHDEQEFLGFGPNDKSSYVHSTATLELEQRIFHSL